MNARTIIFAKAPMPGFAKTRLAPALGEKGAARLARLLLERTLEIARMADLGPVELRATPGPGHSAWRSVLLPAGIVMTDQGDGDLGARLSRAAQAAIARRETVLLIGADCVDLSAEALSQAAMALATHDAAIYPTSDGGYALLGLKRHHPSLFEGIAWSTDSVAFDTLCRIGRLGWRPWQGPVLHDIDQPADLDRLPPAWKSALQL